MDRLDYAILKVMLERCGAGSRITAATSKAICSEMDMKVDTLYRRLLGLMDMGVICKGIKDRREHTYYVTEDGKTAFREVME